MFFDRLFKARPARLAGQALYAAAAAQARQPGFYTGNCSGSGNRSPGNRSGKTRSARGSATERRSS